LDEAKVTGDDVVDVEEDVIDDDVHVEDNIDVMDVPDTDSVADSGFSADVDFLANAEYSADSTFDKMHTAELAMATGNHITFWQSSSDPLPHWWQCKFPEPRVIKVSSEIRAGRC
jgi:hypothetical protein